MEVEPQNKYKLLIKQLLISIIILNSLDIIFTFVTISLFGIHAEGNPWIKHLFVTYGFIPTTALKFFGVIVVLMPIYWWWLLIEKTYPRKHWKYWILPIIAFWSAISIVYIFILLGHVYTWFNGVF